MCGYVVHAEGGEAVVGTTVVGTPAPGGVPAGAEVGAPPERLGAMLGAYSPHALEVSALTDTAGRFTFDELDAGRWVFQARGTRGERAGEAQVRVFDNSLSTVTITVAGFAAGVRRPPGRRATKAGRPMTAGPVGGVRGRVVRGTDGRPVEDATVTALGGAGAAPDIAPVTDADGRFALDGLAAGSWVLRAHGPNGETGEATVRVAAAATVSATITVADGAAWGVPDGG